MANPDGQTTDSLMEQLKKNPSAFDFYAAVRLLQCRFPNSPRIGYSESPAQDPVRFAQSPALDFAPATLEAVKRKNPERPPVVYARHFGLFGPHGPLPLCLTAYARERILHFGDVTFVEFCNVFHHRMASFFFRSWANGQKTVDFDRPQHQCWPEYVGSLVGLGMASMKGRDQVPDNAKLYLSGRLAPQNRNAEGLEAILQNFFGIPTEVHPFVGKWLRLPPDSVCQLGQSPETGSLGSTLIAGSKIWNCQMHFRLRLGPMKLVDLERFVPTGDAFKRLRDWIRLYLGEEFSWDAQIIVAREEVPAVQLGKGGRLGWTTWLKTKPFAHDAEDLILNGSN